MRLLLNQRERASMAGLDMPVAYYLAHSGTAGHHAADAAAQWNESAQPLPGLQSGPVAVVAAGPGELAVRLSCPDRMARAQGSAQTAYAAHSALVLARFHVDFRQFDVTIAQVSRDQAVVARDVSMYQMAQAITDQAVAITLLASGWRPDKASESQGRTLLLKAAASIAAAAYGLNSAIEAYESATAALVAAQNNLERVRRQHDKVRALYESTRDTAMRLDQVGLAQ